jgi:HAMP domain-containing protein
MYNGILEEKYNSIIRNTSALIFIFIVITAVVVIVLNIYFINLWIGPIKMLVEASKEIIKGNYHMKVYINTNDEMNYFGIVFNKMAEAIMERDRLLRERTQKQIVQTEKLASLGRLASGIAHEINTPIQYIGDNTRFMRDSFVDLIRMRQKYGEFFDAARHEYLMWLGCAGAFEADFQKALRSLFDILRARGVTFGVLGKERCTGDVAKRTGNEYQFQELARANIEDFTAAGAGKIVTSCPHCLRTMGTDYREFGFTAAVIHSASLVAALTRTMAVPGAGAVKQGNLTPRLGSSGGGYSVRIVPLRYISATEMQSMIAPWIRLLYWMAMPAVLCPTNSAWRRSHLSSMFWFMNIPYRPVQMNRRST